MITILNIDGVKDDIKNSDTVGGKNLLRIPNYLYNILDKKHFCINKYTRLAMYIRDSFTFRFYITFRFIIEII